MKNDNSIDSSYVSDESSIFSEWRCVHSHSFSVSENEEGKSLDCFDSLGDINKANSEFFSNNKPIIQVELSPHFIDDGLNSNGKKLIALQQIKTSSLDFSSGLLNGLYLKRKEAKNLFESGNLIRKNHRIKNEMPQQIVEQFNEQNLLICSLFLPFKVIFSEQSSDKQFKVVIENKDFRPNLLNNLLASSKQFLWLGILQITEDLSFDKKERLRLYLKENYHCVAIFYDNLDLLRIKEQVFIDYLDHFQSFDLRNDASKLLFDQRCYKLYKDLITFFGFEVSLLTEFYSNPLIYLLDYHLFALPGVLRASNEDFRLILFWGLSFLKEDLFSLLSFGDELMDSLLSCNMLIFNTFQEAKSFFSIMKEKLGFEYFSNKGTLYLDYLARIITIRISQFFLKLEFIEKNQIAWKRDFEGFELIVSIEENCPDMSLFMSKIKMIEALALNLLKGKKKPIKLVEVFEDIKMPLELKKLISSINRNLNYDCVVLIDNGLSENLENALFAQSKFLIETEASEANIAKIQRFLFLTNFKGFVIVPNSLKAWISIITNNYCLFSLLNYEEFIKTAGQILQLSEQESLYKHEFIGVKTPLQWLEESFEDMVFNCHPKEKKPLNYKENLKCTNTLLKKPNFAQISKSTQIHQNKLIIFGLEEVFSDSRSKILENKASSVVLEEIELLASDPFSTIYLTTGLSLSSLPSGFFDILNIGFMTEYGFLHKEPKDLAWKRLFEMDWSWKEVVKKIMENYALKTPESIVEMKESCVIWNFEEGDFELGEKQSEALINHLNESFGNNMEIEIMKLERKIEVRPLGMNKGTMAQMIVEKIWEEKGRIDMIVTIGGSLEDEDLFKGIEEIRKENSGYFVRI